MSRLVPGSGTSRSGSSRALRELLSGAGTVTAALEARHGERVRAVKLAQRRERAPEGVPGLGVGRGATVVRRRVVLVGRVTHLPFVVADSLVVPARLPAAVVGDLERTDLPIGEVLARRGVLPVRSPVAQGAGRLPELGGRLVGHPAGVAVPARTDRLSVDGVPVMLVSERFLPACTNGGPIPGRGAAPRTGPAPPHRRG